jgi:hypothetical protein
MGFSERSLDEILNWIRKMGRYSGGRLTAKTRGFVVCEAPGPLPFFVQVR